MALATNYLELEQDGSPGRMVLKDSRGYKRISQAKAAPQRWAPHIDQIERIAARSAGYVREGWKPRRSETVFRYHASVAKLDVFLDRASKGVTVRGQRPSFIGADWSFMVSVLPTILSVGNI